jgi:MFS family permease
MTPSGAQDEAPWPSPARGWYATIILTLAYVLSFVDRQILTLLVEPIEADLGITDTQMSLLIGAAFAVCYTTFGLPLGWLVDRINRRNMVVAGISFWSVMTAACGVASGYGQLFAARMGVGLGEATLTPATYSILSDSFAPSRLVRAIGVYMSGAIIGIAGAYAIGGLLTAWVGAREAVILPVLGEVRSWQAPFLVLLLPGLVIAALASAIAEPARRGYREASSLAGLVPFLRSRAGLYLPLFIAMGAQSVIVYANLTWMPTLLARRFGWEPAQIGLALGLVFLIAGLAGNFAGAWAGSHLIDRNRPRAFIGICLLSTSLLLLVGPIGPVMQSPWGVLGLLAPTILLTSIPTAIVPTAVQMAALPEFRGQVAALYLFATQLLGLLLGPTMVALFTDYVFADRAAIGLSQSAAVLLAAMVSLSAFIMARRHFVSLASPPAVPA